ncbi:NDP-hexose 2,3-dehydratase family protein [Streptomyces albiflaviniger]|nr:NDP-hexose 2,3-dehydratase family protein [Streptomyces albiflaviniger]
MDQLTGLQGDGADAVRRGAGRNRAPWTGRGRLPAGLRRQGAACAGAGPSRNRYLVVETELSAVPEEPPHYRWMAVRQLLDLIRHSYYVNVEARTLIACLHSLAV